MPDFFIPKSEKDLTQNVHILNFSLETPPEVNDLVSFITSISENSKAYIVGGSVRDSILSAKTGIDYKMKDFDIEVYGTEEGDLISALKGKYQSVAEVGKSFGVLKVKIEGLEEPVDISLPRVDIKTLEEQTSKRGRGISSKSNPFLDLVSAVKRRDLTINSILYDPLSNRIIDPYGGWHDLMEGVIKITDPESFKEDPLRVLRVAQFASRFGFRVENQTFNLCKDLVLEGGMDSLSIERIRDELDKLLVKGYEPSIGLRFLNEIGYLKKIMPEVAILETIPQEPEYHPEGDVYTHTMQVVDAMSEILRREKNNHEFSLELKGALMLSALFHDLGKATKTIIDTSGRIRSRGHEDAGVPIAQAIIKRIYKSENQNSSISYEQLILFLIAEHMSPLLLYQESIDGKDMTKAVRRFVHKFLQNGLTVNEVSWIVEADKRGRNSNNKLKPLALDDKPDLIAAINWFREASSQVSEELLQKNISIFEVPQFLNELKNRGFRLRGGPWIKIIQKCVELDFIEQVVSKDEALNRAFYYFDILFKNQDSSNFIDNKDFWFSLSKEEDPRQLIKFD